jgi:hypothetical protein
MPKNALDNRNFKKIQLKSTYTGNWMVYFVCAKINKTSSIHIVNVRQATLKELIENLRFPYLAAQNFQTD